MHRLTFGGGEHLALELGVVGLEPGDSREPDAEVAPCGLAAAAVPGRLERVVDGAAQALPRLVAQERELGVVQPDALHAGASATRHALGICAAQEANMQRGLHARVGQRYAGPTQAPLGTDAPVGACAYALAPCSECLKGPHNLPTTSVHV